MALTCFSSFYFFTITFMLSYMGISMMLYSLQTIVSRENGHSLTSLGAPALDTSAATTRGEL